ncbi:hypothetical protein DL93DRAFT_2229283 [Clavulina sp. PMI_390]|nr:hypothetical protein DL93DRAFT_2229283 [Clavulina sp. PMI_390]
MGLTKGLKRLLHHRASHGSQQIHRESRVERSVPPKPTTSTHMGPGSAQPISISEQDLARFEISSGRLPEDILVEILTWQLQPRDVVAVSHANRALRLLASLDVVWRCALLRWLTPDQKDFPLASSPTLDLGLASNFVDSRMTFSIECEGIEVGVLPVSSSLAHITWTKPLTEPKPDLSRSQAHARPPVNSGLSLRELYWRTMRIQHTVMKEPFPVLELFASVYPKPAGDDELVDITISARGEVLAIWFRGGEIHLVDLRFGMFSRAHYVLHFDVEASVEDEGPIISITRVEPFVYHRKEGLLVVFATRKGVNMVFQPIQHHDRELPPNPIFVGALRVHPQSTVLMIKVSGCCLMIEEWDSTSDSRSLILVNLTNGKQWSIALEVGEFEGRRVAEVINNIYVVVSWGAGSIFYLLRDDGALPLPSPTRSRLGQRPRIIDLGQSPQPIGIPSSLSFDAVKRHNFFACWVDTSAGVKYIPLEVSMTDSNLLKSSQDFGEISGNISTISPVFLARGREVTGSLDPDLFVDASNSGEVAQGLSNLMTKSSTKFHRIGNGSSRKKGSLRVIEQPELLPSRSAAGDARHCITLVRPRMIQRDDAKDDKAHRLQGLINILLTTRRIDHRGSERLNHRLLFVKEPIAASSQKPRRSKDAKGTNGVMVEPLYAKENYGMLWNPVAGIMVVREVHDDRDEIKIYRLLTD